jgi:hypothetical protein
MKLLMIFILMTSTAFAAPKELGLGVMLGNPTGLNGKYWLDQEKAVDGGLAWSFGKHTNFSMHSDYLIHKKGALYYNDIHPLDLFFGVGGRMEFADDVELGARFPVGLAHKFEDQRADIFAEIAPILDLISTTGLELHFAIGARYYLK